MELWQTYHEISKRFHLTADNWGVTKKSVVSQFSSFGKLPFIHKYILFFLSLLDVIRDRSNS
ncbi:hypothetical protein FH729_23730, partial [Bacteroides thetaiotaomicron]|uniref:Uncharacterized protein n=2 Tax=Bacteroides thetaiotaomicron TaxID=818 RepID=Q89ZI4_BACTN